MQLRHALITLLFALSCADTAVGRQAFHRRQNFAASASTGTSVSSSNNSPSSTTQSNAVLTRSSVQSSSTTSDKSSQDQSTATPTGDGTSTLTTSKTTAAITTASPKPNTKPEAKLPIQPKITPAVGIAGVLLIATGIALALIGIKYQAVHVFLSAAFLTSLCVVVLIVYVMNPPVSDAVQGAYLVAAVVTGLIFGALSMVFKEITEGLGCLLGGFCLSMWFLVLRPGGLIHSTTGRATMIGVFSAVGFALAFSQYTRNYGLIFCTSFAGAMITIIGIDCFSRAGLKEFWIYIWNLNNNEFPIGTTTYPITRGIRVEIACTIVLFLFGVMSQLKIWKIVKERREKKEADKLRDDENRDALESDIGKKIESSNERDRAQWEAIYGNKKAERVHTDSGIGSSVDGSAPNKFASVREREVDAIELDDMPGMSSNRRSKSDMRPTVVVGVASEDELPWPGVSQTHLLDSSDAPWLDSYESTRTQSNQTKSQGASTVSVDDSFVEMPSFTQPGPSIVPLPFKPPVEDEDDARSNSGSRISKGTAAQSVMEKRGIPLNHLALKRHNNQATAKLLLIEDDRASSIAATANDEPDFDSLSVNRLSAFPSPYQLDQKDGLLAPSNDDRSRSQSPSSRQTPAEAAVVEEDDEELVRPSTARKDPRPQTSVKTQKRESVVSQQRASNASGKSSQVDEAEDSDAEVSVVGSLKDYLPEKLSKVAMAYRTNEWAKHIADADQPDDEDMESHSPGVLVDLDFQKEAAKPVDPEALKGYTPPAESAVVDSRKNPQRQSKEKAALLRRTSNTSATPVFAHGSNSQMSLQRQSSGTSIHQSRRVSSTPLKQTGVLLESPVEDTLAASGPYRNLPTPLASTINLMDARNDRLKTRPITMSFNNLTSTPNLNLVAGPDSASAYGVRRDEPDSDNISLSERKQLLEEENMTLAQRKSLIQREQVQQQPTSPTQERRRSRPQSASNPPPPPNLNRMNSSTSNANGIYDSHQPKRSNTVDTVKQNAMLTQWRQSLQQERKSKPTFGQEEQALQAMMIQRRQSDHWKQKQQTERANRESYQDMAMRTGQLTSAHQDAMRRMQAKANQAARE